MCTTGAKIIQPGHEFVLFKNRDFTRQHFDDQVTLTDQAFGVRGLETWDGADSQADRFSGFSIGFNQHLACCDSNVRMLPDSESYDVLVQEVVEHCTTIEEAEAYARSQVQNRLFSWANLLVVTANGIAALEIREREVAVEHDAAYLARANHQIYLGSTPDDDDTTTTTARYQYAHLGQRSIKQIADVFPLLSSHNPDPEHSICNHGIYTTVYSYVVHWQDGDITFYVHQGQPCDGVAYTTLPIVLGGRNDLSVYPSRHLV
jgi:hypothetical protein